MNDLEGHNIGVSVKQKLAMRAGETDKAVTVDLPEVRAIDVRIGEAGVNMPKAILAWLRGESVDPSLLVPQYGKMFAKNDYLMEIK